jgi:hypothetical protein
VLASSGHPVLSESSCLPDHSLSLDPYLYKWEGSKMGVVTSHDLQEL